MQLSVSDGKIFQSINWLQVVHPVYSDLDVKTLCIHSYLLITLL